MRGRRAPSPSYARHASIRAGEGRTTSRQLAISDEDLGFLDWKFYI